MYKCTRKVKFKHSKLLSKTFNSIYHHYRYIYNKTSWLISSCSTFSSEYELINLITSEKAGVLDHISWIKECPSNIRQKAVQNSYSNWKSCFKNVKNKNIKYFKSPYLKRKNRWTINLNKTIIQLKSNYILFNPNKNNYFKFYLKSKVPQFTSEAKIQFDGKDFWLIYIQDLPKKTTKINSCAIDSGIRKLATVYNRKTGKSKFFGKSLFKQVTLVSKKIDYFKSKNHTKKIIKYQNKRRNIIKNCFHQTSHYICSNFSTIICPELNIESLIKGKNKWYCKMIKSIAFKKFYDTINTKSLQYFNCTIVPDTHERYSSQICHRCKCLTKIEGEIFKCQYCDYTIDRDILAAENIYYLNRHLI